MTSKRNDLSLCEKLDDSLLKMNQDNLAQRSGQENIYYKPMYGEENMQIPSLNELPKFLENLTKL